MRKFRRQHEQLRTVIVRVLRPSFSSSAAAAAAAAAANISSPDLEQQPGVPPQVR